MEMIKWRIKGSTEIILFVFLEKLNEFKSILVLLHFKTFSINNDIKFYIEKTMSKNKSSLTKKNTTSKSVGKIFSFGKRKERRETVRKKCKKAHFFVFLISKYKN